MVVIFYAKIEWYNISESTKITNGLLNRPRPLIEKDPAMVETPGHLILFYNIGPLLVSSQLLFHFLHF